MLNVKDKQPLTKGFGRLNDMKNDVLLSKLNTLFSRISLFLFLETRHVYYIRPGTLVVGDYTSHFKKTAKKEHSRAEANKRFPPRTFREMVKQQVMA